MVFECNLLEIELGTKTNNFLGSSSVNCSCDLDCNIHILEIF